MINSVLSEGTRGLQAAQRGAERAASDIARAAVTSNPGSQTQPSQAPNDQLLQPVNEAVQPERSQGLAEPLIELRRQEQLFNASAQVVSVADQTLGTLLDIRS